jgi:DNA-binding transcriptional regulator YhcF (GntR family)
MYKVGRMTTDRAVCCLHWLAQCRRWCLAGMQDNDQVTEPAGGPEYQRVADDLRRRIASSEFPVGAAIPSTAKLSSMYGVSVTVVRAAVAQLRADGLVTGHPGKGVFVISTPDAVAEQTATVEVLARQVEELRAEIARLQTQIFMLYAHLDIPHSEGQSAAGPG